jgi:hypothetical protein
VYRLVNCATWDDTWFADLDPSGKLFFLYLITNRRSTCAGAFEVSVRQMVFETGLSAKQIEGYLNAMSPKVRWWPEHNIVWLRNFYHHQGAYNERSRTNARKVVAELPIDVQCDIAKAYPELVPNADTLCIPYAYPMDSNRTQEADTDRDTEQNTETDAADARLSAARKLDLDFQERFWTHYPKGRGSRKVALGYWERMTRADRDACALRLPEFVACFDWQKEGGRFVRHAERWLRDEGWKNDVPPDPPGWPPNGVERPTLRVMTDAERTAFEAEQRARLALLDGDA